MAPPSSSPKVALLFVLVALLFAAAHATHGGGGADVPGLLECAEAAERVGENNLLIRLAACSGGTTEPCCQAARGLLQLGEGGELAGCVCRAIVLETTLSRVEQNPLAKNFGVSRDSVVGILKNCGIKYAGGEGDNACPCDKHSHCVGEHAKHHGGGGGRRLFSSAA